MNLHEDKASALVTFVQQAQSKTLDTTPAPTVRPPSRMAKRRPGSMATGAIRSNCAVTLSPGITISTPLGNVTVPAQPARRDQHNDPELPPQLTSTLDCARIM